jgi:oxygen-dependent protoporphyrinogen oxidase
MTGAGQPSRVIVIGAGMAGLAAAWRLSRAGADVIVLEQDDRVGGRVYPAHVDGRPVELGADFLTNFYPNTFRLAEAVGLAVANDPVPRHGAVPRDGRMHAVTPALQLLVTRLVPWRSKLRLIKTAGTMLRHWPTLDHHAMWRADTLDTRSVTDYARAALDTEILEYVFAPSLSGFLYWEPEETSQAMLFIMLKGGIGVRRMRLRGEHISALPEKVSAALDVQLGARVNEVRRRTGGGYLVRTVVDGQEHLVAADGIVCATTASPVPLMMPELNPEQRAFFTSIRYSTTVSVALACQGSGLAPYNGILFPRRETHHLAAATQRSADGIERSGSNLLVLFATSEGARSLRDADDETVVATLIADLRKAVPAFDPGFQPRAATLRRWPEALPIFDVGHLRALKRFAQGEFETGALVFAGDYLGGPFVEGAVTSGLEAATRLLDRLRDGERGE